MSLSIDEILNPFGGKSNNDINNILNTNEEPDLDDEIVDICKTIYLSSEELGHYLLEHKNELTILSLNIQSIFDPNSTSSWLFYPNYMKGIWCLVLSVYRKIG